jgi:hypothetical protein
MFLNKCHKVTQKYSDVPKYLEILKDIWAYPDISTDIQEVKIPDAGQPIVFGVDYMHVMNKKWLSRQGIVINFNSF